MEGSATFECTPSRFAEKVHMCVLEDHTTSGMPVSSSMCTRTSTYRCEAAWSSLEAVTVAPKQGGHQPIISSSAVRIHHGRLHG